MSSSDSPSASLNVLKQSLHQYIDEALEGGLRATYTLLISRNNIEKDKDLIAQLEQQIRDLEARKRKRMIVESME